MKFNKSEIMKNAWRTFRANKNRFTFSECLKTAWNIAKEAIAALVKPAKKMFDKYAAFEGVEFKRWSNYGKRRVYFCYRRTNCFIDLNNGNEIVVPGSHAGIYTAAVQLATRFMDAYEVR